jgi:hypothetical protein
LERSLLVGEKRNTKATCTFDYREWKNVSEDVSCFGNREENEVDEDVYLDHSRWGSFETPTKMDTETEPIAALTTPQITQQKCSTSQAWNPLKSYAGLSTFSLELPLT